MASRTWHVENGAVATTHRLKYPGVGVLVVELGAINATAFGSSTTVRWWIEGNDVQGVGGAESSFEAAKQAALAAAAEIVLRRSSST